MSDPETTQELVEFVKNFSRRTINDLEFIQEIALETKELLRLRVHGDPHVVSLILVETSVAADKHEPRTLLAPFYYDRAWLTLQYNLSNFSIISESKITVTDEMFSNLFYNGIALDCAK